MIRNHCATGWWSHTGSWSSPSAYHVHCFPLPANLRSFTTEVRIYVDGGASQGRPGATSSQLVDNLNAAQGPPASTPHAPDRTWRPRAVKAFDYDR